MTQMRRANIRKKRKPVSTWLTGYSDKSSMEYNSGY